MLIRLENIKENEFHQVFPIVKDALFPYVDDVYGWDDGFQKSRLKNDYELSWYHWLYDQDDRIGLVCFKTWHRIFHLHLLILLPEFRGEGLGHQIMLHLKKTAIQEACTAITLSSFIQNHSAVRFYQKLGYSVTSKEEHFYSMGLEIDKRTDDFTN